MVWLVFLIMEIPLLMSEHLEHLSIAPRYLPKIFLLTTFQALLHEHEQLHEPIHIDDLSMVNFMEMQLLVLLIRQIVILLLL